MGRSGPGRCRVRSVGAWAIEFSCGSAGCPSARGELGERRTARSGCVSASASMGSDDERIGRRDERMTGARRTTRDQRATRTIREPARWRRRDERGLRERERGRRGRLRARRPAAVKYRRRRRAAGVLGARPPASRRPRRALHGDGDLGGEAFRGDPHVAEDVTRRKVPESAAGIGDGTLAISGRAGERAGARHGGGRARPGDDRRCRGRRCADRDDCSVRSAPTTVICWGRSSGVPPSAPQARDGTMNLAPADATAVRTRCSIWSSRARGGPRSSPG